MLTVQLCQIVPSLRPAWPVLQRLRQMRWRDVLTARRVNDGARELEHALIRPRRELELAHGRTHHQTAGDPIPTMEARTSPGHIASRPTSLTL